MPTHCCLCSIQGLCSGVYHTSSYHPGQFLCEEIHGNSLSTSNLSSVFTFLEVFTYSLLVVHLWKEDSNFLSCMILLSNFLIYVFFSLSLFSFTHIYIYIYISAFLSFALFALNPYYTSFALSYFNLSIFDLLICSFFYFSVNIQG